VAEVESFLAAESPAPEFRSLDERFQYLVGYQRRLHGAGLAVPGWPVDLGGRGLDARDAVAVSSALGRRGAPELINFVGTDVLGPALLRWGDPERLVRWMPRIASADEIWCQLFSEPDAGSDLTSLRTRAERTEDGWTVNGQKVWSTWAQFATWGFLLARTGDPETRHRGISAFAIDMGSPGITIKPLVTMTEAAEFAEVFFDEVQLPHDALLGEVNGGWALAQTILNAERGPYAVRRAAVIGGAMTRLLERARDRVLDATQRRAVVQAFMDFRMLELRIDTVVEQVAAGRDTGPEAALTKQLMTAAEQSTYTALQCLLGLDGLAWSTTVMPATAEEYLYSRAASIYGGTAQIQRDIIGERLLGLPREPGR
jgi:alkylation response protein AidB-like acyl-CoA dehydrogenase